MAALPAMPARPAWLPLLAALSWAEWRHHAWRHGAALVAVMLGVALAFAVQLINASALSEFAGAVRAVNGEPDIQLAARTRDGFADALFESVALSDGVAAASPVVELDTVARRAADDGTAPHRSLRVIGIDALRVAPVAPALLPRAERGADRLALLDPDLAFLNPAARDALGVALGDTVELRSAAGWQRLRIAGTVAVGGLPLAVIDIASAQARFGFAGRLTRIDIRLAAGVDVDPWLRAMRLPADVLARSADAAQARVSNLSRAYRVNLTVLALVALLVGGFLVYSVISLSVAQRTPSFALLGVLGMAAAQRRALVLTESAVFGFVGALLGVALGGALAWTALRAFGGDLGGGYFPGVAPALTWSWSLAIGHLLLGMSAAMVGAWWPARAAERLAPAQALKALGSPSAAPSHALPGLALMGAGTLLALLPAVDGLPIAAYASVAALVAGGVALVPSVVQGLLAWLPKADNPNALLAIERARFARQTASAAVAGVVASLSLCVALTVMVTSFREAVIGWLGSVLPADLYLRSATSTAASDQVLLPQSLVGAVGALPGVARVQPARMLALQIDPRQPPVTLIARPIGVAADPLQAARQLPLVGAALAAQPGEVGVYISEPMAMIYRLEPGAALTLPLPGGDVAVRVLGVWRDYARQFGAIAIDAAAFTKLTGDARINELALWLAPAADTAQVIAAIRQLAVAGPPLDVASSGQIRQISLAIFDRSFAVTRYLQAVAIAIGLVGVAASLSAQVLARRKEFGLLAHLGLTRTQVVLIVGAESAAWLAAGCLLGLGLGIAVSVVLVHVVNPQSFHWTMDLLLPWGPLMALTGAVLALGIATSIWSARHAAGRAAVLAVKEDW